MAKFWERIIHRSSEEPSVSSDEIKLDEGKNWPLLGLYFIGGLIVAAAIVFGVRAIYQHAHNNKSNTNVAGNNGQSSQPPSDSSNNSGQRPPSSPSSLPNNGPGNVIALFIGASLAATGLHYVVQLRRGVR